MPIEDLPHEFLLLVFRGLLVSPSPSFTNSPSRVSEVCLLRSPLALSIPGIRSIVPLVDLDLALHNSNLEGPSGERELPFSLAIKNISVHHEKRVKDVCFGATSVYNLVSDVSQTPYRNRVVLVMSISVQTMTMIYNSSAPAIYPIRIFSTGSDAQTVAILSPPRTNFQHTAYFADFSTRIFGQLTAANEQAIRNSEKIVRQETKKHYEARQLREKPDFPSFSVVDPFGIEHRFVQRPRSFSELGSMVLRRYARNPTLARYLEGFLVANHIQLTADDADGVVPEERLASLAPNTTLIMSALFTWSDRTKCQLKEFTGKYFFDMAAFRKGSANNDSLSRSATCNKKFQVIPEHAQGSGHLEASFDSGTAPNPNRGLRHIAVNAVSVPRVGRSPAAASQRDPARLTGSTFERTPVKRLFECPLSGCDEAYESGLDVQCKATRDMASFPEMAFQAINHRETDAKGAVEWKRGSMQWIGTEKPNPVFTTTYVAPASYHKDTHGMPPAVRKQALPTAGLRTVADPTWALPEKKSRR
ncbi:hypothetical protein NMY22_g17082 [Coprinellus aureogranulatus]|nr:hypothetical protein NMY22_g17082 [Coprinellus aureogranulatus]